MSEYDRIRKEAYDQAMKDFEALRVAQDEAEI